MLLPKKISIHKLQKRLNFLHEVINKLELKDIELVHARAEDYGKGNREKFDVVTARAVAPINILIEYCFSLIVSRVKVIGIRVQ